MAKSKTPKRNQKSANTSVAAKAPPLARFMKTVWSNPETMEKFKSGREGRQSVLEHSVLSKKNQELVLSGCMRHLMAALSGAAYEAMTSNINAADTVNCGHAACANFMAALKPTNSGPQLV